MESVYHIVTVRVNETSWAHVWRLRSRYLRTGYDRESPGARRHNGTILWPVLLLSSSRHMLSLACVIVECWSSILYDVR
jgi:hypothetical protein